jgi:hypothetical protein
MSHDALMRWEWEGGTPISAGERDEAVGAEQAENAPVRPQPKARERPRQVATVSSLRLRGLRGDDGER